MRILYHHRIRSKDGQYVHVEELIGALRVAGHDVIVAGPAAIEKEEFGSDAGLVATLKKRLPRWLYELLEFLYTFIDYAKLVRAVRKHAPDCLYERYNLFLPSGVWIKRKFGLPMILEVNAPIYDERSKYDGIALDALAKWSETFTWRGADYVLPVTHVLAERIRHTGVPDSRIVVIPNGINETRFKNSLSTDEAKRRLGLEGRLVLGFVGFMRDWHGLDRLVDLVAGDSGADLHVLLVGDGPARGRVEQAARERGVANRVTVTGVVSREHVAEYIAAFDVALQPDVVAYASPLKLFEYLALGCVIVAPRTRNLEEILVDGENAILFDPRSRDAFGNAVLRACRDRELRTKLSYEAKATIRRKGLTWAANAQKVVTLFESLIEPQDRAELPDNGSRTTSRDV